MENDLKAVLNRYPSSVQPLLPVEPLGNAGGMSGARIWRYPSGLGPLAVRAWPYDGPGRAVLETTHRWLKEAAPLGFVPVPIPGLDGRTLQVRGGRLWEVTPWMSGAPELGEHPSPSRVRGGFEGLAAFHQRLARYRQPGSSAGLQARLVEIETLIAGGFTALRRVLEANISDPASVPAREWLEGASKAAPGVLEVLRRAVIVQTDCQPCVRDVRPEHLLFSGNRLTGLVDFGAAGVDTVAADLGRLLPEWLGDAPALRTTALDAYHAVRPIRPEEMSLIPVFEVSAALLGGGHWVRWHFVERRRFEDPGAVVRGLNRSLKRLRLLPPGSG